MKTTLLFVITAALVLAAEPAKEPAKKEAKLTDTQKLRLSKIEADFLAQKSAALEAEVTATRANAAMQQLQARHVAEAKGIVAELKLDEKCTVVKRSPAENTPPDWSIECPAPEAKKEGAK